MGEEVKLYRAFGSPMSARIDIALKLKGVDYTCHEEDLSNKSPSLLKYNPIHKKIPVLVHNEKPIAESLIILEYIDETWDQNYPLLSKDPYERAKARFWARFIDDKCLPSLLKACMNKQEREKSIEEAIELLKFLEDEVGNNKFFGGETIGIVDIVGCFIAYWLPIIQEVAGIEIMTEEKLPKLCCWSDELVNHSVVKEALPPRDLIRSFIKARLESTSH